MREFLLKNFLVDWKQRNEATVGEGYRIKEVFFLNINKTGECFCTGEKANTRN